MPPIKEIPPRVDANRPYNNAATRAAEEALGVTPDSAATAFRRIKREYIEPNHNNPRHDLTAKQLADMRHSLMANGQQQAVVVRPHPKIEGKWQVVIGDTRFRASEPGERWGINWQGLEELDCKVVEVDDATAFLMSVIENRDRNELTTLDECMAVRKLKEQYGYTKEKLMEVFGADRGWVDNRIAAAKVDAYWHPLLAFEGTMSKVVEADKVKDPAYRHKLYRLIEGGASYQEVLGQVDTILKRTRPAVQPPQPKMPAPVQPRQGSVPQSNYEPFSNSGITTSRSTPIVQTQLEFVPGRPQAETVIPLPQFEDRIDHIADYLNGAPQFVFKGVTAANIDVDARLRLRDKLQHLARQANAIAKIIDAIE